MKQKLDFSDRVLEWTGWNVRIKTRLSPMTFKTPDSPLPTTSPHPTIAFLIYLLDYHNYVLSTDNCFFHGPRPGVMMMPSPFTFDSRGLVASGGGISYQSIMPCSYNAQVWHSQGLDAPEQRNGGFGKGREVSGPQLPHNRRA